MPAVSCLNVQHGSSELISYESQSVSLILWMLSEYVDELQIRAFKGNKKQGARDTQVLQGQCRKCSSLQKSFYRASCVRPDYTVHSSIHLLRNCTRDLDGLTQRDCLVFDKRCKSLTPPVAGQGHHSTSSQTFTRYFSRVQNYCTYRGHAHKLSIGPFAEFLAIVGVFNVWRRQYFFFAAVDERT